MHNKLIKINNKFGKSNSSAHKDLIARKIHKLRIELKHQRYLLEFFQNFYTNSEIEKSFNKIKKLQDSLGAYNDTRVQQKFLQDLLAQNDTNQELLHYLLKLNQKRNGKSYTDSIKQIKNTIKK